MLHPYLWRYLKTASWPWCEDARRIRQHGEPHLRRRLRAHRRRQRHHDVLTGSGVDEAWATGTQLAEAVIELLKAKGHLPGKPRRTYVKRRRASWVKPKAASPKIPRRFSKGVATGMIGMALAD